MLTSPRAEDSAFTKNFIQRCQSSHATSELDVLLLRTNVVKGGFSMMKHKHTWYRPCIRERVYISAVADGSTLDLRLLYREVLPLLQSKAAAHGVDLSFICPDYGLGENIYFPNMEWEDHRLIAEECLLASNALCFISLLADDYGKVSMPKSFLTSLVQNCSPKVKELIDRCCVMDNNAVPPRYVVSEIKPDEDGTIDHTLQELIALLAYELEGVSIGDSVLDEENPQGKSSNYFVGQGIIEWVGKYILANDSGISKSFWFLKEYHSSHHVEDRQSMVRVDSYASWLHHKLHSKCIALDTGVTKESFLFGHGEAWEVKWAKVVEEKIFDRIDYTFAMKAQWDKDGCGLGVPGNIMDEILHHCNWAHAYSKFIGRRDLVQAAMKLFNDSPIPLAAQNSRPNNLRSISFYIEGSKGVGKTALMTKLADTVYRSQSLSTRPVIVRYIGSNRDSSSILLLLRSICHQIHFAYGIPFNHSISLMPYPKVVKLFHSLIQDYPVALFLDGLDMLSNNFLARTDLLFLSGASIHPDTRVVVSTEASEVQSEEPDVNLVEEENEDRYGCCRKLSMSKVPRLSISNFDLTNEDSRRDCLAIIDSHLNQRHRSLSTEQRNHLLERLGPFPSALQIHLDSSICVYWTSDTIPETINETKLESTIHRVFDELEAKFGRDLVRAALGFIALSADGIKEIELVELLLFVDNIYNAVLTAPGYRIDIVRNSRIVENRWLRLRSELYSIILESRCGCLYFLHSPVKSIMTMRLADAERMKFHSIAAQYFGNIIPLDKLANRLLTSQPMIKNNGRTVCVWLSTAVINTRRCIEAPHHMIAANMLTEAIAECCTIENVAARVLAGFVAEQINFMAEIAHRVNNSRLHSFLRWVRLFNEVESLNHNQHLVLCAMDQPPSSPVRTEMIAEIASKKTLPSFAPTSWIRCKEIAVGHDVDDIIGSYSGHEKSVLAVDTSTDGRYIVSCSEDSTIRMWDSFTGMLLHLLEGHKGAVYSVAFSPDGTKIVSGARDRTVGFWRSSTGALIRSLDGHSDAVHTVCFNQSGNKVASGSRDRTIIIWNTSSYQKIISLDGHRGVISCVRFCASDNLLLSASEDDSIALWDVEAGSIVKTFVGHKKGVTSLACRADGQVMVSSSRDKTIRIWNVASGDTIGVLERHSNRVTSVDISPDGSKLISACDDNHILLWDVSTHTVLKSYQHQPVTSVRFFCDGHQLVAGSFAKKVTLYDSADTPPNNPDTLTTLKIQENIQHDINCICFTSDGRKLVTGNLESSIYVWDVATGGILSGLAGHEGAITALQSKGNTVISGSADHSIIVWDLACAEQKYSISNRSAVTCVSLSPSGKNLLVGTEDKKLRIVDLPDQCAIQALVDGHSDVVLSAQFSQDETLAVSGGDDNAVVVWNLDGPSVRLVLRGHTNRVNCVAVTRNSLFIVSGSADKSIRVWNSLNGSLVNVLSGHTIAITCLVISGEDTVISGSVDKTIRIWNIFTGVTVNVLQGHTNRITGLAVSEDGHIIASSSSDRTLRIWDASSGEWFGK